MPKSTEEAVKEIIAENLGVKAEALTPDVKFTDLGADSLDAVEMGMAVEEEFDIEIPDDSFEKFLTVGDLIKYVEEHKRKPDGGN